MNDAPNRADTIAENLRAQILNGKYAPGERLPSERELAERLAVNRSSVREALKQLEQLGMITIRRGGGARVLPFEKAGLGALRHALGALTPDRELVAQWLDVHELVIAGAARIAVERGNEHEFARAKLLLRKLCAPSTTSEQFVATSDELTELITLASRNVVLQMVRNGLTRAARKQSAARIEAVSTRKLLLPIVAQLESAIDARDPVATEEGVRRLFRSTRALMLDLVAGPIPHGTN